MRPIQWHLENHFRMPKSLEKEIPVPRAIQPDRQWWTKEANVPPGQALHTLCHALQVCIDTSSEG